EIDGVASPRPGCALSRERIRPMLRSWWKRSVSLRNSSKEQRRRAAGRWGRPSLEVLEDRTLLHTPAPAVPIPQPIVDSQVAPTLMNNLPQITSSLGGASNVPIIGTALAKSLTTDQLTSDLVNDVLKNLNEQNKNYTDQLTGNVLSVTVDTVH